MAKRRNNRTAGHGWECEIVHILKARGMYPHAVTTRAESCSLDGQGVDIMNCRELEHGQMNDTIQAKSAVKSVPYPALLDRIRGTGRAHPVIFHKQTERVGKAERFNSRDFFAISYLDSYLEGMAARTAIVRLKALGVPAVDTIISDLGL